MEMATKIRIVQMNKHKAQMNVENLIKETKFTQEGQISKLLWKNQEVGECAGSGLPTPTRLLLKHSFDIRLTKVVLRKPVPKQKLKLLIGFSNWCLYGKTGLDNKEFLRHISIEHDDYALPNIVLNREPWVDWVDFYSDEAEILFSVIDPR
jgi:hypothetical protein